MREEKAPLQAPADISPEAAPAAPSPSPSAEPAAQPVQQKSKARPVIMYISIMFGVALLLLLLSFFMQQRNHEALLRGISSTGLTAQTIVDLELENAALEDEVSDLREELDAEKAHREALEASLSEEATKTSDQRAALEWLMALRSLYEAGEYDRAKSLLEEFQNSKLIEALPADSVLPDHPSPHDLLEDIVLKLS